MIFELSKDKSLLNLLSKVDLDNETSELIKGKASISDIRKSLESNISSSNLIQYRKYILKATEEEEEEAAEKDRLQSEEEETKIIDDDYAQADIEREQRLESAEYGEMVNRQTDAKAAYKYLSVLQYQVADLEKIRETARVKSDKTVIGANRAYQGFGNNQDSSEKMIDLLRLLTDDSNYLTGKYSNQLVDGILPGKKYSKDKDTQKVNEAENKESKDINVKDLQTRVVALIKTSFPIGDSEETMPFYDAVLRLHTQRWKKEPKNTRDSAKRKRELQGAQRHIQGINPKIEREYKKAAETYEALSDDIVNINLEKQNILDKITELEEIEKNSEKIVKNKLQTLIRSLSNIMQHGQYKHKKTGKVLTTRQFNKKSKTNQQDYESVLSANFIQEHTKSIKDIQANPEKYLEEATLEIESDIEDERTKLEKIVADLEVFERMSEPLKLYRQLIGRYIQGDGILDEEVSPPPSVIKEKITTATGIIIRMRNRVKQILRLSDGASNDIEEGLADILLNNENAALTLTADGLDFDGMPTIDADRVINLDEATSKYNELVVRLQEIVNEVNHMLTGE